MVCWKRTTTRRHCCAERPPPTVVSSTVWSARYSNCPYCRSTDYRRPARCCPPGCPPIRGCPKAAAFRRVCRDRRRPVASRNPLTPDCPSFRWKRRRTRRNSRNSSRSRKSRARWVAVGYRYWRRRRRPIRPEIRRRPPPPPPLRPAAKARSPALKWDRLSRRFTPQCALSRSQSQSKYKKF